MQCIRTKVMRADSSDSSQQQHILIFAELVIIGLHITDDSRQIVRLYCHLFLKICWIFRHILLMLKTHHVSRLFGRFLPLGF